MKLFSQALRLALVLSVFFVDIAPVSAQVQIGQPEFEAGRTYFDAENYERALQAFEQSYALSKQPALFYNYALCYDKLGNPHRALEYLDRYLADVKEVDGRKEVQAFRVGLKTRIEAGQSSSPSWLLIATGLEGTDSQWMNASMAMIRDALIARGETVWESSAAADRYEQLGSIPAPQMSQGDIDTWVARSRSAVKSLARADYKRAHRQLKQAQLVAEEAAAELNREAARAKQVLDTCLYLVRAYIETGKKTKAKNQALTCRRQVPGVEPSAYRHTPDVRDLIAQVDRELAAMPPAILSITSTPSGCLTRINGVEIGITPITKHDLPNGAYRLQVECDDQLRPRAHRVIVGGTPNAIHVDTELDRALRTRLSLQLLYADHDEEDFQRTDHAAFVAATLSTSRWLLFSRPRAGILRIDLRERRRSKRISVWLKMHGSSPLQEQAELGANALLDRTSRDLSSGLSVTRKAWKGSGEGRMRVDKPFARTSTKTQKAGYALLSTGLVGYGVSAAMLVLRRKRGDDLNATPTRGPATKWKNGRLGVWLPAGVGAGLTVTALPMVLPIKDKTPWWAWLSGGIGVGLVGYAMVGIATLPNKGSNGCNKGDLLRDSELEQNLIDCVNRARVGDRAFVAAMGAAPLLTIPLVYLLRRSKKSIEPAIQLDRQQTVLSLKGTF